MADESPGRHQYPDCQPRLPLSGQRPLARWEAPHAKRQQHSADEQQPPILPMKKK